MIKYLLGIAAAAIITLAWLDGHAKGIDKMIYQNENLTVVLYTTPCENKEVKSFIAELDPDVFPNWYRADVQYLGENFEACFAPTKSRDGSPVFLLIDETRDAGILPAELFRAYNDAAI